MIWLATRKMRKGSGRLKHVQPKSARLPVRQRPRVNWARMLEVLMVHLLLLHPTIFFVALGQEIYSRMGVSPTPLPMVGTETQVAPDPPTTVLPAVNKVIGGEVAQVTGIKVHPSGITMSNRINGSLDHDQTEQGKCKFCCFL